MTETEKLSERWFRWRINGSNEQIQQVLEQINRTLPAEWSFVDESPTLRDGKTVRRKLTYGYHDHSLSGDVSIIHWMDLRSLEAGGLSTEGPTEEQFTPKAIAFLEQCITPAAKAVNATVYDPTDEEIFFETLSFDARYDLVTFSKQSRKVLPLNAHETQLWQAFLINAFKANQIVPQGLFADWLATQGWSEPDIHTLLDRFYSELELLSVYREKEYSA
jgi:hypothetical protein